MKRWEENMDHIKPLSLLHKEEEEEEEEEVILKMDLKQ
jgi:hypothetical protein